MGLGGQLIDWPQELVDLVADRGHIDAAEPTNRGRLTLDHVGDPGFGQPIRVGLGRA